MKKLATIIFISFCINLSAQNYKVSEFNHKFVVNTLPSDYVKCNFSIAETNIDSLNGFTRGQAGKDFIINIPQGFEFNITATASVYFNGTDCFINYWNYVGNNKILVNITTIFNKKELSILYFENFEIRATQINSGVITSSCVFKIDNSLNGIVFGKLSVEFIEGINVLNKASTVKFSKIYDLNGKEINKLEGIYIKNNKIYRR